MSLALGGGALPPSRPSAPSIAGPLTIGGTLAITPGAGAGPVTSYVATCDGRALGAVVNGHVFVAADIGSAYTVHAVGPGGVSGESVAIAWTPATQAASIGWMQVPLVGDMTGITLGSGTDVSDVADRGTGAAMLTQASVPARPAYTTVTPLDGHAALSMSYASSSAISKASGGPTGAAVPHWLWTIAAHTNDVNSYCGFMRMGATGASAVNSFVGCNGGSIWYGRGGNGTPALGVGDNHSAHLIEKYFDGSKVWILRDGELQHDGATAGTPVGTPDAGYNIVSAQWGLGGGFTGTADALIYAAGWGTGAVAPVGNLDRLFLGRWTRRQYPTLARNRSVRCFGDSQTAGNGPVNPWPGQMPTHGLALTYDRDVTGATSGYKTSDIIAGAPYLQTAPWGISGLRPTNVAVVWAGTNDLYAADTAANAWTRLQTICSALKSDGYQVIVVTCMDRQQAGTPGGYAAQKVLLNASIRGGYASIADVLFDVDAMAEFSDSTNLTYFQADAVHLSQAGHDLFATRMAAAITGMPDL